MVDWYVYKYRDSGTGATVHVAFPRRLNRVEAAAFWSSLRKFSSVGDKRPRDMARLALRDFEGKGGISGRIVSKRKLVAR